MSTATASMNNNLVQTLSILDRSGLRIKATIILAYRPILLMIVSRTMNDSVGRKKTRASDIDVSKRIAAKEMKIEVRKTSTHGQNLQRVNVKQHAHRYRNLQIGLALFHSDLRTAMLPPDYNNTLVYHRSSRREFSL